VSAHDRPDPDELLDAVREFLDAPPGDRDRLHRTVAGNVVAMVSRQLAAGPADEVDHVRRLAVLGVQDDAELARLAATVDEPDPRFDLLTQELAAWARRKVEVVNPRYLEDR